MRPKITDVAKTAGVSTATVSHVLNGTKHLTDKTRKKVLDAISELEYSPNLSARSFRVGKTYLIGFVVPDILNSYFATLIEQIESILTLSGYNLLICNTKESLSREINAIKSLSSGIVDGLVIASTANSYMEIGNYIPNDFPVVFIDRIIGDCPYDTVTISSGRAVIEGVNYLIDRGHRNIGYIAGLRHLSTTKERLNAYKSALKNHSIEYDEHLVKYADSMYDSANHLVDDLVTNKCTAIFATNSIMTNDVIWFLTTNGLCVGKDIEVVGFEDSPINRSIVGMIPVIAQPTIEMGIFAGERILQMVENPLSKTRDSFLYSVFREKYQKIWSK